MHQRVYKLVRKLKKFWKRKKGKTRIKMAKNMLMTKMRKMEKQASINTVLH